MAKKIICLFIAAIMLCSFIGCGKEKDDGIDTLTWLIPGSAQSDFARITDAINKITEKEINAKVDIQIIDTSSYSEKMKMNMSAGVDFDICFTGFVNNYFEAVTNGGFMDITDLVKEKGLYDIIPDYGWEATAVKGRI